MSHVQHVEAAVVRLAAERGGVAPDAVSRASHFRDDLGYDSLDVVELTMALEELFELSIPDADVETMLTVGDVIDYVVRRTSDAPGAGVAGGAAAAHPAGLRYAGAVFFVRRGAGVTAGDERRIPWPLLPMRNCAGRWSSPRPAPPPT